MKGDKMRENTRYSCCATLRYLQKIVEPYIDLVSLSVALILWKMSL